MDMVRSRFESGVVHQLERLFGPGTLTGLSEAQLLDRFATAQDEAAFEALVARHGPMVLGVCRQFLRDPNDVDDAFQATFLVLVRKAGSLRQKDLLGNWLYGVAYRVALRARTLGIRRQMRLVRVEEVEGLAGGVGSGPSEPASAAVLRDEERPLVHEEVNRLPRKYRTPIVLCYFEGLSHEEAAARLGWPVGTVKGRLSRARDLLRTRLSRRGVAVSSTVLAAHLAGSELKASVPVALTHLTIKAALAVATESGAVLTTSSAVSLPVASLTEGVLQAMALSHIKAIVIPILVAAGVLTTGATVVAFQFGGVSNKPREDRPHGPPAGATTKGAAPTAAQSSPAQGEVQLARQIVGDLEKQTAAGPLSDPESFHTWSLRLLEAEKRATPENSPPVAAYEGHAQRMGRMEQVAEKRAKAGQFPSSEIARWKYFAKEAERMLEEAKGANPGGMMGFGRMMGGPGMMRGMMAGMGASGGPQAEKPGTAESPPNAGGQAPPKPQAGIGGGFGGPPGGGGGDSGADDQAARIQIARMSAAISTIDKNPKNLAVIKKLEEPVTLHFPMETPLELVLKHIKDASRGADGKKLSIYVDPRALEEADKTMGSPVFIDLEDVPLRFSLRLLLKQLGLAYCVRDGVVIIGTGSSIHQELMEAQAEQMGLNPDKFPFGMMGGQGGMGGMGGGGMGSGLR
jgi:RNA polymerase sigma factor (sigma-70 family)